MFDRHKYHPVIGKNAERDTALPATTGIRFRGFKKGSKWTPFVDGIPVRYWYGSCWYWQTIGYVGDYLADYHRPCKGDM